MGQEGTAAAAATATAASTTASAVPVKAPAASAVITDADVLLGRGGVTNSHIGNVTYRDLVKQHQAKYLTSPKMAKSTIAQSIVDLVKSRGGRFLTQTENGGPWHEVGSDRAREKTSQALREKAPEIRGMVEAAKHGGSFTPQDTKKRKKKASVAAGKKRSAPTTSDNNDPGEGGEKWLWKRTDTARIRRETPAAAAIAAAAARAAEAAGRVASGGGGVPIRAAVPKASKKNGGTTMTTTVSKPSAESSSSSAASQTKTVLSSSTLSQTNTLPANFEHFDVVHDVHPNDVLYSQGAGFSSHPGNVRLRHLVKHAYFTEFPQSEKSAVAKSIVSTIRNLSPPGRFLIKMNGGAGTEFWVELGDEKAQEKTIQALSDKKAQEKTIEAPSEHNLDVVHDVHPNDVLYGRGAGVNSHPGNVRFRDLVKNHQAEYAALPKLEKSTVAKSIVSTIRNLSPPGRFLMKMNGGGTEFWVEVGDGKAREKTSQALRERGNENDADGGRSSWHNPEKWKNIRRKETKKQGEYLVVIPAAASARPTVESGAKSNVEMGERSGASKEDKKKGSPLEKEGALISEVAKDEKPESLQAVAIGNEKEDAPPDGEEASKAAVAPGELKDETPNVAEESGASKASKEAVAAEKLKGEKPKPDEESAGGEKPGDGEGVTVLI